MFYSKKNRHDSRCKLCVKQKKRTTYEHKKEGYILYRLKTFADIVLKDELRRLNELDKKLTEVIEQCQKRKPQP